MKEPIRMIRQVTIEEYFTKEDGEVFWHWRFAGTNHPWRKELTPLTDIPYVHVPYQFGQTTDLIIQENV